jgi:hypothetical protein
VTPVRALFFRVVAADRDDEPGVLGNLPRSRPGQRSAKRGGASTAKKAAPKSQRATRAQRKPAATRRKSTSSRSTPPPRPRPQPPRAAPPRQGGDPIGQAVQLAGKVATVGLRTAAGIVKRLPRP